MIQEGHIHFSELLILLGIAGLTVPFLHRFKISPVLGFLLCGIAAGPYGLPLLLRGTGWFDSLEMRNSEIIRTFSELGIVFLMFMLGLKLSLEDLWRMRRHILGLGCRAPMFINASLRRSEDNQVQSKLASYIP